MKNSTHNSMYHGVRITAAASAFLVLGTLSPGIGAAANTSQNSFETSGILVAGTQGMDRRQDRRANRQDCRQEEGLVGKDKRDCKQEGRGGDDSGEESDKESGQPDDTTQPAQTDQG